MLHHRPTGSKGPLASHMSSFARPGAQIVLCEGGQQPSDGDPVLFAPPLALWLAIVEQWHYLASAKPRV